VLANSNQNSIPAGVPRPPLDTSFMETPDRG
jgi:hypothetical protein